MSKTQTRLYEMMTENTGTHFLDSGMSDGRHWQQNQKMSEADFLARPKATLETEYGTYPTLDLFHFLNDRLTLSYIAQELQTDFEQWVDEDVAQSFYDTNTMETFIHHVTGLPSSSIDTANSYNWDNYLSQVIQYITFEYQNRWFVMLQIHGGADVRGGYTRPQIFQMDSEYTLYSMQDAVVHCSNLDCDFDLSIRGCLDICDSSGSLAMTSSEFHELKKCPECEGELIALAPEPTNY